MPYLNRGRKQAYGEVPDDRQPDTSSSPMPNGPPAPGQGRAPVGEPKPEYTPPKPPAVVPNATTGAAAAPAAGASGQYVNFANYFNANQGAAQNQANTLAGKLQAQGEAAQGRVDNLATGGPGGLPGQNGLLTEGAGSLEAKAENDKAAADINKTGTAGGTQALLDAQGNLSTPGASMFNAGMTGAAGQGQFDSLRAKFGGDYYKQQSDAAKLAAANAPTGTGHLNRPANDPTTQKAIDDKAAADQSLKEKSYETLTAQYGVRQAPGESVNDYRARMEWNSAHPASERTGIGPNRASTAGPPKWG